MQQVTRLLATALLVVQAPPAAAQDVWRLRLELADPELHPQAVQVALVDWDPLVAFAAQSERMSAFLESQLANATDDGERLRQRRSHVSVAWNMGFREVTGDELYLLAAESGGSGMSFTANTPDGPRWLIAKVRRIEGAPVCWSLPFKADRDQEASLTLTGANRLDLLVLDTTEPPEATEVEVEDGLNRPSSVSLDVVRPIDVARLRELHHITGVLGDRLWPGFDARAVPLALNFDDRYELLLGHPNPPPEYLLTGQRIGDEPLLLRQGVSRFGPKGGGWAVKLAGAQTVYVGPAGEQGPIERYLLLMLHEAFHVYQDRYRPRTSGAREEPPENDPAYSAMIGLESHVLAAALAPDGDKQVRELAKTLVAVRHARRAGLSTALVRSEGEHEFSEGTATYSQVRALELLADAQGLEGSELVEPRYQAFGAAQSLLDDSLSKIRPSPDAPITFFHSQYQNGMAICMLLDRVRPDWKDEMRERGITQFALLEREFPLGAEEEAALVNGARERFGYEALLARQTELIQAHIDEVLGYVTGPGRRYRVHHGKISGSFRWKPEGPVLHVTPQQLGEEGREPRSTLWVGGIRRFERGELLFVSRAVPVLYRRAYLEWIDREPAPDGSDLVIESGSQEGDVYEQLVLKTDGFTLHVPRARVVVTDEVVDVFPLGEQ
jgi:hypothetical protein